MFHRPIIYVSQARNRSRADWNWWNAADSEFGAKLCDQLLKFPSFHEVREWSPHWQMAKGMQRRTCWWTFSRTAGDWEIGTTSAPSWAARAKKAITRWDLQDLDVPRCTLTVRGQEKQDLPKGHLWKRATTFVYTIHYNSIFIYKLMMTIPYIYLIFMIFTSTKNENKYMYDLCQCMYYLLIVFRHFL